MSRGELTEGTRCQGLGRNDLLNSPSCACKDHDAKQRNRQHLVSLPLSHPPFLPPSLLHTVISARTHSTRTRTRTRTCTLTRNVHTKQTESVQDTHSC